MNTRVKNTREINVNNINDEHPRWGTSRVIDGEIIDLVAELPVASHKTPNEVDALCERIIQVLGIENGDECCDSLFPVHGGVRISSRYIVMLFMQLPQETRRN